MVGEGSTKMQKVDRETSFQPVACAVILDLRKSVCDSL